MSEKILVGDFLICSWCGRSMSIAKATHKAGRPKLGKVAFRATMTRKIKQIAARKASSLGLDFSNYLEQLVRRDNADALPVGAAGGVSP